MQAYHICRLVKLMATLAILAFHLVAKFVSILALGLVKIFVTVGGRFTVGEALSKSSGGNLFTPQIIRDA